MSPGPYRSNIAQGGLLTIPFRDLLLTYQPNQSRQVFREALERTGLLSAYTESRRKDMLERFFVRFPTDVRDWPALRLLLTEAPPGTQALALYFHTARTETIVRDFSSEFLLPLWQAGKQEVQISEAQAWVAQAAGLRGQHWSPSLTLRVAQGLLSIARDAGVLEGVQRKRIRYPYLPDAVTLYVLVTLQRQGVTSGQRVLGHPDWQTLVLTESEVGAHLVRLAERNLIEWSATGSVYNLQLPDFQPGTTSAELIHAAL